METMKGLYKNYLGDGYYDNKRNLKKVEKALKYWRCEVEAVDNIAEDLEYADRRHNIKILHWYVNELKRIRQSGLDLDQNAPKQDNEEIKINIIGVNKLMPVSKAAQISYLKLLRKPLNC